VIRRGLFGETMAMSFDSLRAHKMRSFLTLLGIMIGVMTVIGMISIVQGLNASFLKELQSAGSDLIMISKRDPVRMGRMEEEDRRRKDLTYEDALALERECPLVKAVAVNMMPSVFRAIEVRYRETKTESAMIIGINEKFPVVYNIYLPKEGRFLTGAEILHSARVCLLGYETAETLFPGLSPIGRTIRVGPESFTVVGVMAKRGQMFGQSRDNLVGIPITTLRKTFPYDPETLEIAAVPRDPESLQAAIQQIVGKLRQRRKVAFGQPNDFAVFTQDTMLDLYNQITGAAYMVMIVISSIGLLVGGIGVMNVMLVSAKERTREIGIRKALGARSRDILRQFLIEAMVLTGAGGVLGTLLGFGVAFLVRTVTPLPASVTSWSVVLGLLTSVSVGLFFGIVPARRAARVDPIVSLRYE
jgi:putative ABC transport system permease protein